MANTNCIYNLQEKVMNHRDFFYLVANMRSAQKAYFDTRDPKVLRAAIKLEKEVDEEIARVRAIVINTQ